jgi:hypothetical protein
MNTSDSTPGISYRASLPLDWQIATDIPTSTVALWRQSNLALLQTLATLEAAAPEKEPGDAEPAMHKAIERLEAKLDVALALLTRLLSQGMRLPPERLVTLSVGRIAWQSNHDSPTSGALLQLRLYLSPRLPQPLQFFVRVVAVEDSVCQAELLDMDAEMEEWLTRTLFRYHRRALQARQYA